MDKTFKIKTLEDNIRLSTQELLQIIYQKIEEGYSDFEIEACGQHNIGGSVWSPNSEKLIFRVKNPGQRVGAMAMKNTKIIVEGSAPADVGWLNSGAEIIVKGDGGDTTAHCAAGGKIYIAGRTGTRSGAMMKHDPKYNPPQFWVLKNTGSFSFEFMGGGIAVICGYGCENLESVLGERSCVGMVGGTIYFRGNYKNIANCAEVSSLNAYDEEFLTVGLKKFLTEIEKESIQDELNDFSQWKKIVPNENTKNINLPTMKEFRREQWVEGGIFGDFIEDDFKVYDLATTADGRLNIPVWDGSNCCDCNICLTNCPQKAIYVEEKIYISDPDKCIGCSICKSVCPKSCWQMNSNIREIS